VCGAKVTPTKWSSYGVTGDELEVKGEQSVQFSLNGHKYCHTFLVSSLATDADAILGLDFLNLVNAKIDLEGDNLWMLDSRNFNHASSERRVGVSHGRAHRAALTSFSTPHRLDGDKTCLITHSKKQKATRRKSNFGSSSITLTEAQPWVAETVNTIKIPPRTKTLYIRMIFHI